MMKEMDSKEPMIKTKSICKGRRINELLKWKLLAIGFIAISIALLIALIVVATKAKDTENALGGKRPDLFDHNQVMTCAEGLSGPDENPRSAGVFDDLTVNEIIAVRDYLLKQTELKLTRMEEAAINRNYISSVQLLSPPKDEALAYLDGDGNKPERKAVAVVFHGADDPPVVKEYIVSPASNPTKHAIRKIPGKDTNFAPFNARPYDFLEYIVVNTVLVNNASEKLSKLMRESYDGYSFYPGCTEKCLTIRTSAPMGFTSQDDRHHWVTFARRMTGDFEHTVDLSLLADHAGADTSKWKILSVIYNNQTFNSVDELVEKYNMDIIEKIKIAAPMKTPLFSSYERRGNPQPAKPMRGPELYEPDGKRYSVKGRHVSYMSWSFDFRMDSYSGMQVYDIRFNGERIIYELSLQEAAATYGGYYPNPSWDNYLDSNWALGTSSWEMVRAWYRLSHYCYVFRSCTHDLDWTAADISQRRLRFRDEHRDATSPTLR